MKTLVMNSLIVRGLWFALISLFLKKPIVMSMLFQCSFLNLRAHLCIIIPLCKELFYELAIINENKAKKIATLIIINELDYTVQEAREIYDFYDKGHEHPMTDEILYNEDYMMRYCDHHTFEENTKRKCFHCILSNKISMLLINNTLG